MTYRRLRPGESGIYRALRLESLKRFPDSYGSRYEREVQHPKLPYETYIEEEDAGKFVMGMFRDGKLVGICAFFHPEDPRFRHRGAIIQMYVQPESQGKGAGSTLLAATLKEAYRLSELEQIALDVVSGNRPAIRLYRKAGFQHYGTMPNYLKKGDTYLDLLEFVHFRPK